MPISFNNIPANWKIPLFYLEVDPSMAGLPVTREPALMAGYMFTAPQGASLAGTATPNIPIPIGTLSAAQAAFGQGSMLAQMFARWYDNSFAQEVWALPIADPTTGAKAHGDLTVNGPATDFGTLALYIAGQFVQVGVSQDDTADIVAANIMAAINDDANLPVVASQATPPSPIVTLTCKWTGLTGNDIYITANYYGHLGGEDYPPGITLTFPTGNILNDATTGGLLNGGSGLPTWDTAITNINVLDFKYVALPFTDQETLNAWELEYGFDDGGRWGWLRQMYGIIFSGRRDSYAEMLAWSATQNNGIYSALGIEIDSPSPVWEWSAAYCSKGARAFLNDPARPLQTLELTGIKPAPLHQRWVAQELQVFATAGIATHKASPDGPPMILRETTTYQLNTYGMADDAYELLSTMATLTRLFRNMRYAITTKYPRHKLADDGTRYGVGQAIVTPSVIKSEIVALYAIDEFNGLVENAAAFKDNLVVERDNTDPNRVNVLYPPDLVNQLRVFAVLAQFRLQYNRGVDQAIGALSVGSVQPGLPPGGA
jgi:phage tail sheath gpL-like